MWKNGFVSVRNKNKSIIKNISRSAVLLVAYFMTSTQGNSNFIKKNILNFVFFYNLRPYFKI